MYIQVFGASVNAAVIAYHLSEVGHKIFWQPADELLAEKLAQQALLFDDYELSAAIYRQLDAAWLTVGQEQSCTIAVLALTAEQYDAQSGQFAIEQLADFDLVINYSHLGLGETDKIQQSSGNPQIVYIPDFLQEGNLLRSFITQSLIVGIQADEQLKTLVQEIFRPIFPLAAQYNFMSIRAAEFTKLSISGFLAMKVSFMNDLSNAAEALDVDIEEVRIAMSTDTRIGEQYLYPGCGFGGGNLTRDVMTLKQVVHAAGNENGLLDQIWAINEYQKEIIFRKLWTLFDCQLKGKVIAFWGAAFKPNTNSLAQAPIIPILEACWAQGAITRVHDPRALDNLQQKYPDQPLLQLCSEQYDAVHGADALCVVTEWKQYWSPDYDALKKYMRQLNFIDGRNIYHPNYVRQQGFHYLGIGR